jgi:hypothetical protein
MLQVFEDLAAPAVLPNFRTLLQELRQAWANSVPMLLRVSLRRPTS